MQLFSEKDFITATGIDRLGLPALIPQVMQMLQLTKINKIFDDAESEKGICFLDALMRNMNISMRVSDEDLERIPASGSFIAVANHPFGALEGMIFLKAFCTRRADFKLLANFLLHRVPNLQQFLIPVNPFETVKSVSSLSGTKLAMASLRDGHPLGIFPAGEVSSFKLSCFHVTDKPWSPVVAKMILKAKVPVVPVYFHGHNGMLFHILSLIHPKLRIAKLPSEFANKEGSTIRMRIGAPVEPGEFGKMEVRELLTFLRTRTYRLSCPSKH